MYFKKALLAFSLCVLSINVCFSQDTLKTRNRGEHSVSVERDKEDSLMIIRGKEDARAYYSHNAPEYGVFAATAICFPCGIVTAAVVSSKPPADVNLGFPKPQLMLNDAYRLGYTLQAHEIKKRNVKIGFLEGTFATVVIGIIYYSFHLH